MTKELEIQCPFHGRSETLELPDSYFHDQGFDGEVPCVSGGLHAAGGGKGKGTLQIRIQLGKIVSVSRAKS